MNCLTVVFLLSLAVLNTLAAQSGYNHNQTQTHSTNRIISIPMNGKETGPTKDLKPINQSIATGKMISVPNKKEDNKKKWQYITRCRRVDAKEKRKSRREAVPVPEAVKSLKPENVVKFDKIEI